MNANRPLARTSHQPPRPGASSSSSGKEGDRSERRRGRGPAEHAGRERAQRASAAGACPTPQGGERGVPGRGGGGKCGLGLACLLVALGAAPLSAHGGQYRGPGNVAPPSPASSGSSGGSAGAVPGGGGAGGGAGASGATGSGAALTGTSVPSAPVGARVATPRGLTLDDDPTRWEFWWEFGKDPYLRLREAVYGASAPGSIDDVMLDPGHEARQRRQVERPSDPDLALVVETLAGTLQRASDRDTISSCLVALAKIGRDGGTWRLHDQFVRFLPSGDQELRETAALAIGIAGQAAEDDVGLLVDLVLDTPAGRKASGDTAVNERTRAFAAFGCGLLLARGRDLRVAHRLVAACSTVLAAPATSRDLRVAAIEALSLFPPAWDGAGAQSLRDGVVAALLDYYDLDLGAGEQLLQAHVPTALQRLLRRDDPRAAALRERFAAHLVAELDTDHQPTGGHKVNPHVAQSCAIALGGLALPWQTAGDAGEAIGRLLVRIYREHRDLQTRSFALLSLGRLGGAQAQAALLEEFANASRAIEQPWCAVALGVLVARDLGAGRDAAVDGEVARTLRRAFAEARNPAARGALAIALGLCQDLGAADALRGALIRDAQRDDLAGYLALALGIMRDPRATGEVRGLLATATRRPQVMLQATRALGLLGDSSVADGLCRQLEESEPSLARLSAIALALGQIGDRRSLPTLLRMLGDARLTPLTRAFAAVALGGVGDKDELPWNAAYATQTNYRAATATLTDGVSGILDIL